MCGNGEIRTHGDGARTRSADIDPYGKWRHVVRPLLSAGRVGMISQMRATYVNYDLMSSNRL